MTIDQFIQFANGENVKYFIHWTKHPIST